MPYRRLIDRSPRRTAIVWARWLAAYVAVTAFFVYVGRSPELRISHGVLAYLLVVIGASREARRGLSAAMVVGSYLAVDFLFIEPLQQFGFASRFDFFILAGFVVVSVIILHLVSTLQRAAELAMKRAAEIEQLGTQQLQLEREAARTRETRENEAMKSALIASIAHDLRSPITTVKMLADPEYGIDHATALRRISDEADRINQYLFTMRHFGDVGASGTFVNVESHVIDDVIGTAIASYASVLRGRDVQVLEDPCEDIILVRCDLTLSLQVLGNLLQNAVRHSPANSPIEIWTVRAGQQGRIVVGDRGPGVLPSDVDRIFAPRTRGTGASPEGQGMGLAIARTFARAQLGDVTYKPRDGGGAEFAFTLPLSTEIAS